MLRRCLFARGRIARPWLFFRGAMLVTLAAAWLACGGGTTLGEDAASTSAAAMVASSSSGAGGNGATSSATSAAGGTSAGGSGGTAAGGGGGGSLMVLDPSSMELFELPIGSLRYAVGGHHGPSNTCVTLVWWGSFQPLCAMNGMQEWPYVVITPNAAPPCTQWDYSGNVNADAATGCVQFTNTPPLTAAVDVTVDVSGGLFTGTIVADNVP